MNREERSATGLLGSAHFLVDLACTAMLAGLSAKLGAGTVIACAILYNGLAFAFQLPIGALADSLKLTRSMAAAGCVLVSLGLFFSHPFLLCLLLGLGNACFHIGGGREALKRGTGNAASAGRFVAPGAIGIFFGPKIAELSFLTEAVLPLILFVVAAALLLSRKESRTVEVLPVSRPAVSALRRSLCLVCMFLTVLLRSYLGTVLRYPLLSRFGWALGFTLCIFAGKFLGGILADRWGAVRFSTLSQLTATVLLAFSSLFAPLALPGILLFNTSMAMTATVLYQNMPLFPGTMFGLTTFALYLGVLPRLLGWGNPLFCWWGLGLLGLLSTALLLGGLILGTGGDRDAQVPCPVAGADADP